MEDGDRCQNIRMRNKEDDTGTQYRKEKKGEIQVGNVRWKIRMIIEVCRRMYGG